MKGADVLSVSAGRLCWGLRITSRWLSLIQKTFGGKPNPVAVSDVTGERYPPPEGDMLYFQQARALKGLYGGPALGELSGGNWMVEESWL